MKMCIRCLVKKPRNKFWSGRATCIDCANKLWYRPKSKSDPKKSPNWPMIEKGIKMGWIQLPKEDKEEVDFVALSKKLNQESE